MSWVYVKREIRPMQSFKDRLPYDSAMYMALYGAALYYKCYKSTLSYALLRLCLLLWYLMSDCLYACRICNIYVAFMLCCVYIILSVFASLLIIL